MRHFISYRPHCPSIFYSTSSEMNRNLIIWVQLYAYVQVYTFTYTCTYKCLQNCDIKHLLKKFCDFFFQHQPSFTLKKTIKMNFTEFLQRQYLSIQIQLKCLKVHLHHGFSSAPAKHQVTQSPVASCINLYVDLNPKTLHTHINVADFIYI